MNKRELIKRIRGSKLPRVIQRPESMHARIVAPSVQGGLARAVAMRDRHLAETMRARSVDAVGMMRGIISRLRGVDMARVDDQFTRCRRCRHMQKDGCHSCTTCADHWGAWMKQVVNGCYGEPSQVIMAPSAQDTAWGWQTPKPPMPWQ